MEREITLTLRPGEVVCIMSDPLASSYRVWSDPVQVLVEPSRHADPDVVDMSFRFHECPEVPAL